MKALVGAFNQEKALVGAFSVIVQLHRLIDLRHYIIHHIILAPSIVCILYPLPTYSLSSHLSILPSYCTMWPRCEKYCPNTRHAISPSMHLSKIFIHIDIDVKRQMICVCRGNHCLTILLLMMLAFDINTTLLDEDAVGSLNLHSNIVGGKKCRKSVEWSPPKRAKEWRLVLCVVAAKYLFIKNKETHHSSVVVHWRPATLRYVRQVPLFISEI